MANNKTSDNQIDPFGNTIPTGDVPKFLDELVRLKGCILECYIGDQAEQINYDDFSTPKNCVIIGRLTEIFDRQIILDCFFIDKTGQLKNNNRIYINQFQLRAMTVLDGNGSLCDVFLDTKDAEKIRKSILKHDAQNKK